jgi:hypothetical protein
MTKKPSFLSALTRFRHTHAVFISLPRIKTPRTLFRIGCSTMVLYRLLNLLAQ